MDEILQQLSSLKDVRFDGLTLAKNFLNPLAPCLEGNECSPFLFELADKEAWSTAIKRAETLPVWTHDQQKIIGATDCKDWSLDDSDWSALGDVKDIEAKAPATMPEGAIMLFDAVITTPRKDHDGDVLESKGAVIDEKQALLWQHMSTMPIGKMVKKLSQNSKRVTGRFAIADTPLGKDAALLVKFGALRISHGFKVLEYEPIKDKDGRFLGWHIKKFEVLETSLVSVPANQDAIILAHSTGKLHSPLVKSWAKSLKAELPKSAVSGWKGQDNQTTVQPEVTVNLNVKTGETSECSCGQCKTSASTEKQEGQDSEPKTKILTTDQLALNLLVNLMKGESLDRQTLYDLRSELDSKIKESDEQILTKEAVA